MKNAAAAAFKPDTQPDTQSAPLTNRAAQAQLASEIERLLAQCLSGCVLATSRLEFINFALIVKALAPLGLVQQRLQKAIHRCLHLGNLLDTFEQQGVIITSGLTVPDQGSLDLFVRFPNPPKKANFAIAFRSKTNAKVVYNEQKELLCLRRGGLKPWQPDPIKRLSLQEFWLRNNQIDLFGSSSKDRNRPLIKLLVLTGATALADHSEHCYTTVGSERVLLIRRQSSVYILHEHQLIPFIQHFVSLN